MHMRNTTHNHIFMSEGSAIKTFCFREEITQLSVLFRKIGTADKSRNRKAAYANAAP